MNNQSKRNNHTLNNTAYTENIPLQSIYPNQYTTKEELAKVKDKKVYYDRFENENIDFIKTLLRLKLGPSNEEAKTNNNHRNITHNKSRENIKSLIILNDYPKAYQPHLSTTKKSQPKRRKSRSIGRIEDLSSLTRDERLSYLKTTVNQQEKSKEKDSIPINTKITFNKKSKSKQAQKQDMTFITPQAKAKVFKRINSTNAMINHNKGMGNITTATSVIALDANSNNNNNNRSTSLNSNSCSKKRKTNQRLCQTNFKKGNQVKVSSNTKTKIAKVKPVPVLKIDLCDDEQLKHCDNTNSDEPIKPNEENSTSNNSRKDSLEIDVMIQKKIKSKPKSKEIPINPHNHIKLYSSSFIEKPSHNKTSISIVLKEDTVNSSKKNKYTFNQRQKNKP